MKTVHNFYAGPCVLPGQAVEAAIEALKDFSGTGLSDNRHKFTFMYFQIHMIQRPHFIFSGIVNFAQIHYPYQCFFHN